MTAFVIHRGMEISDPVFCSLGEVGMHFTLLSHCCDAEYRGKLPKYRFHRRISFKSWGVCFDRLEKINTISGLLQLISCPICYNKCKSLKMFRVASLFPNIDGVYNERNQNKFSRIFSTAINTFVKKLTSVFRKLHRNRDVTLDEAHNHKHSKNNFNSSHCKQLNLTEVLRVSRAL